MRVLPFRLCPLPQSLKYNIEHRDQQNSDRRRFVALHEPVQPRTIAISGSIERG
jgi:hypothetical protein